MTNVTTMTLAMDDGFIAEMAGRFPCTLLGSLSRVPPIPPQSPAEWVNLHGGDDGDAVENSLVEQVGGRWEGLDGVPPIRRAALCLLAALAAFEDVSEALADANRWAVLPDSDDLNEDDEQLTVVLPQASARALEIIKKAAAGHAYDGTVALEVVRRAKEAGVVLPNAHFMWLRERDRTMWLLISGYGRPDGLVETLGIRTHHAAERMVGRRLEEVTDMDSAADAVELAAAMS